MPRKRKCSKSKEQKSTSSSVPFSNNDSVTIVHTNATTTNCNNSIIHGTNHVHNSNFHITSLSQKGYDNLSKIILPRINHKKHNPKFMHSENSTTFISSVLFNKESIILFNNSYGLSSFIPNDFISKRIKDVMPRNSNNVNILRYNEEFDSYETVSDHEFFEYVKNGYLLRNRKLKSLKKKVLEQSKKTTRMSSKISRGISGILPGMSKKIIGINQIYSDYDLYDDKSIWNNWNDFSMIHNLYESFDLIVYSYSHRIKSGDMIHYCTRTKLKFPCNFNCCILFHGLLVHSGSASKREPTSSCSFGYSNDARIFASVKKNDDENNSRKRSEDNQVNGYKVTSTSTKKLCPQFEGKPCSHCNDVYKLSGVGTDCFDNSNVINISELHYNSKKSVNSLIVGNLKDDGWAVYKSLNIRKYCRSEFLWSEMDDLINGQNGLQSKWSVVQGTNLKGRCILTISEVEMIEKHMNKVLSISTYFRLIREQHISTISGFEKSTFTSMSIIINRGRVIEQSPHSDFEWTNNNNKKK